MNSPDRKSGFGTLMTGILDTSRQPVSRAQLHSAQSSAQGEKIIDPPDPLFERIDVLTKDFGFLSST